MRISVAAASISMSKRYAVRCVRASKQNSIKNKKTITYPYYYHIHIAYIFPNHKKSIFYSFFLHLLVFTVSNS